jgi:hypothetical protein
MEFTFKHRKFVAGFTLATIFIVLLLAFLFTVFSASRYEGSFEDNIMLTADNIGYSISSTEISHINSCSHEDPGGIAPAHFSYPDIPAEIGFVLTITLFSLLLAAAFCLLGSENTPVSLRTRIDQ